MKKTTLATQGAAGIAVLAILSTLAQADTARYSDINDLALDMTTAATVASNLDIGKIIEMELEIENSRAVWELDIVTENGQVITVEIDGYTGDILSTHAEDNADLTMIDTLSLTQAIDRIMAIEQGAMVEAELENDHDALIWEIESVSSDDRRTTFRIDAESGELLL